MKKLLALVLLLPALTATAGNPKVTTKEQIKNKSAQAKVYRHHENNWRQPEYGYDIKLFKCFDSWGHKLRGKFTSEQQYLIELGGGSCHKIKRRPVSYGALNEIHRHDFPVDDVYRAIREIKRNYGLGSAKVVESENIHAGFKTFKYTLVFQVDRHHFREFRVKHSRWSGKIRNIYEV